MKPLTQEPAATYESVWATIREVSLLQKEIERQRIKSQADFERRMRNMEDRMGSMSNNHGSFAEEYFFNSFEKGQRNFFGNKFNTISKGVKSAFKTIKDEYDIVLYNDTSIAIIEVKYKAHVNDVEKVLNKAETFKILFPYYETFKIYLGLASLSFYPELEQKCLNEGIAVIKQVGDTVIINEEGLKAY